MNDRRAALRFLSLACAFSGSAAVADTRLSADASLEGGYSSSPYLAGSGGAGSASATAQVSPSLVITGPHSTTSLAGDISHTSYTNHYGGRTNYSASGSYNSQLSELSGFSLTTGYSHQTYSSRWQPATLVDQYGNVVPDPQATQNFGQTLNVINASAEAHTTISPHGTLGFQAHVSRSSFPDRVSGAADYVQYGTGATFTQAINATTSATAGLTYSRQDYSNIGATANIPGNSSQLSPSLSLGLRLASRINLAVSGGITFSTINRSSGSFKHASFSGHASLCRTGDRSNLCMGVGRSVVPSNYTGVSTNNTVSLSYSYALTPRSSFGLDANYSKTDSIAHDISGRVGTSYKSASGNYRHQLGERLSAVGTVRYIVQRSLNAPAAQRDSFYASIGISYRLGRIL